jgi:hypothetical protein
MNREAIISAAMDKAEEMTRMLARPKPSVDEWRVAQPYVRQALSYLVNSSLGDFGAEIVTRADLSASDDP